MNTFQRAIHLEPQSVPPIWFMRQAGRYHSHYQALRAKHTFDELCRTPELAAQVAMGPIEDFDFDAAILFSDILYPLDALGLGLSFSDKGPHFEKRLVGDAWSELVTVDEAWSKLSFQGEAVKLTRERLPKEKALLGFVGAPWTLWTFAVEEVHKSPMVQVKKELGNWGRFRESILPLLERMIADQLKNGADLICIFDSSAGELSPQLFDDLVRPDVQYLAERHPGKILFYSKGTSSAHLRNPFWRSGKLAALGLDHRWNLAEELQFPRHCALQGNFDQTLLHLSSQELSRHLNEFLKPFQEMKKEQRRGWILGLGHGILPKTPEANVRQFIQTAREILA